MIKIFFDLNHRKLATLLSILYMDIMLDMDIIDHVAAALGPLAAALGPEIVFTNLTRGRSARPPSLS